MKPTLALDTFKNIIKKNEFNILSVYYKCLKSLFCFYI
jgi:hypothetical protein